MDQTRLGRMAGPASVALAFGGVLGGMLASPSFSVTDNALSELWGAGLLAGWVLVTARRRPRPPVR